MKPNFVTLSSDLLDTHHQRLHETRNGNVSYTPTGHETYVHHISVDPTGLYLATCSSDRRVHVYSRGPLLKDDSGGDRGMQRHKMQRLVSGANQDDDEDDADDEDDPEEEEDKSRHAWVHQATLQDHSGTVHKVAWCHQDLGQCLATCGVDRRVNVYRVGISPITMATVHGKTVRQATLNVSMMVQSEGAESNDSVCDVAFAPPRQCHPDSLLFAVASFDGTVRFYAGIDNNNGTRKLSPKYVKICPSDDAKALMTTCGWIPVFPTSLKTGVGFGGSGAAGCGGGYNQVTPSSLATPETLAAASRSVMSASTTSIPKTTTTTTTTTRTAANHTSINNAAAAKGCAATPPSGVCAIAWATNPTETIPTVAVGTMDGTMDIYVLLRREKKTARIPMQLTHPAFGHEGPSFPQLRIAGAVTCIAWAPTLGREFDVIAVCSRRGTAIVKLFRVAQEQAPTGVAYHGEVFFAHVPCVSAVWDSTGTILTTVSDMDIDGNGIGVSTSRSAIGGPAGGEADRIARGLGPLAPNNGTLTVLYQKVLTDHQSWVRKSL